MNVIPNGVSVLQENHSVLNRYISSDLKTDDIVSFSIHLLQHDSSCSNLLKLSNFLPLAAYTKSLYFLASDVTA